MVPDSRALLLALLDEPTGAAALARAGRMLQAGRAGGLAAGELEDGFRVDPGFQAAPPVDPGPELRGLPRERRPVRLGLTGAEGRLDVAHHPAGGWMVRWRGRGVAVLEGNELAADRWTVVRALPTAVEVGGKVVPLAPD